MQTLRRYSTECNLREFTATVLSCTQLDEPMENGACFAVILDQTAFFPEGGGQTADTGVLMEQRTAEPDMFVLSAIASVLDVQEVNGEILHYTDAPVPKGVLLTGMLNWDERFSKMQNHTGEHLVSGIVYSLFGYDNVGFHLGSDGVTVDFNGVLTDDDLRIVEQTANRAVRENFPVRISFPTPEECAEMFYRSKLDLTENVRIVTIEGYDICACCAPHVDHTGAIGGVKLLSCEKWKGGVRIHMLCGMDAMADYSVRVEQTARISNLLSCKQLETADAVERLMKAQQAEREESAKLRRALLECRIAALEQTDGNIVVFDSLLDPNTLRNLVNAGVPLCGGVCAVFQGNDTDGYRYIIGSRTTALRAWAKELNHTLEGRGGGSDEMIQGTVKATAAQITAYLK